MSAASPVALAQDSSDSQLNVAVIGGGIAGLTAAYLLSQKHNVTLYEQHVAGGLDAFSVDLREKFADCDQDQAKNGVSNNNNEPLPPLDVPFRIHTPAYYPNLVGLCEHANIETQLWENTASFTDEKGVPFFSYSTILLSSFFSMPFLNLNVSPFSVSYVRMLYDLARFRYVAGRDLRAGNLKNKTLQQYLTEKNYSPLFKDHFIYPFMAGLCTCSFENIKGYPAEVLIQFWQAASSLQSFRRFKYGSTDVVRKLTQPLQNRKFNCKIQTVIPNAGTEGTSSVTVVEQDGARVVYDHVVIATQANHAAKMVKESGLDEEFTALSGFKYEPSRIIVHSDLSLVPNYPCNTKWNIMTASHEEKPMINLWLNKVYPALPQHIPIFETWNPWTEPQPDKLWSTVVFERPVVTHDTTAAVNTIQKLQGRRNVWFCGAYATPGVPLLESGVCSAKLVATRLGVHIPWETTALTPALTRRWLLWFVPALVAGAGVGVLCLSRAQPETVAAWHPALHATQQWITHNLHRLKWH